MLILLLENPSDDSVEMAVDFCKEVNMCLEGGWGVGLFGVVYITKGVCAVLWCVLTA
jgi:hypothetical protein